MKSVKKCEGDSGKMEYNEEMGFPYDYLFFQYDEILQFPSFKEKVESLGFSYNENNHCFIKKLENKNASL